MNAKRFLGYGLLASPFIAVGIYGSIIIGVVETVEAFGIVGIVATLLYVGTKLLE